MANNTTTWEHIVTTVIGDPITYDTKKPDEKKVLEMLKNLNKFPGEKKNEEKINIKNITS